MCFSRYLLSFLRLIKETKQIIDNLPGEDAARLIGESSYNQIKTVPVIVIIGTIALSYSVPLN